jgi:NhaP-type Na+/H+ and K+/H+ antiporter
MSRQLTTDDRVEGTLRVRSVSGDWMAVGVTASLMLLDQHTTAALVTVSFLS